MKTEEKLNCWEHKQCGYYPGQLIFPPGKRCAVITTKWANGINRGNNAGRSCWAIGGTRCVNNQKHSFEEKISDCVRCDFYQLVQDQESDNFQPTNEIFNIGNLLNGCKGENKKTKHLSPDAKKVFFKIHEELDSQCRTIRNIEETIEPLEQLQLRLINGENPKIILEEYENWIYNRDKQFADEHTIPQFNEEIYDTENLFCDDDFAKTEIFSDPDLIELS